VSDPNTWNAVRQGGPCDSGKCPFRPSPVRRERVRERGFSIEEKTPPRPLPCVPERENSPRSACPNDLFGYLMHPQTPDPSRATRTTRAGRSPLSRLLLASAIVFVLAASPRLYRDENSSSPAAVMLRPARMLP